MEPFFFAEPDWIPAPEDWHPNIVRGRTYDLTQGIGRRLWDDVVMRLRGAPSAGMVAEQPVLEVPGGYGDPVLTPRRLGQGTFKAVVLDAYGRQCAVSREKALPALEAAHIQPFSEVKRHQIGNGLLLRSDIHRLFDKGYVTVTPDYRVEASARMREDFNDGENYLRLHGSTILVPENPALRPEAAALTWHNENRYRG